MRWIWWLLLAFTLLTIIACVAGCWLCPEYLPWLTRYEHVAQVSTIDTSGRPCVVDIGVKFVGYADREGPRPSRRGPRPRLKLTASGDKWSSTYVDEPVNWWGGSVLNVRAVPGGVDIFPWDRSARGAHIFVTSDFAGGTKQGTRYLIKDEAITLLATGVRGADLGATPGLVISRGTQHAPLISVIHAVSGMGADSFDPVPLIQAVNALQAVGENSAVATLRAYLAKQASNPAKVWETDRVRLIVRMLFTAKDPSHPIPPLRKGLDAVLPGSVLEKYPDFPLVTVQGIPFLLERPQGMFCYDGEEDPSNVLDYCLQHAQFRTQPVIPLTDPVHAAESLMSSDLWAALRSSKMSKSFGADMIRLQVLMAMGRVIPCTSNDVQVVLGHSQLVLGQWVNPSVEMAESLWVQRISDLLKQDPKWDSSWQDFVPSKFTTTR